MMILLTSEQADQVRGPASPMHELRPVQLANGGFILPMEVLSDPAFAVHHEFLSSLTTIDDPAPEDYYRPFIGSTGATGPAQQIPGPTGPTFPPPGGISGATGA
jgi:hypothetical protein